MCGKNLSIYGVRIPRKCIEIESMDFYSRPSSTIKTPGRIFWKSISTNTKWVEKTMIWFIKNSIKKYQDDLEHWFIYIIFCMICKFFKCDGFSFVNNVYQIVINWKIVYHETIDTLAS